MPYPLSVGHDWNDLAAAAALIFTKYEKVAKIIPIL